MAFFADLCEGNILVPMSNDRNTLIEQTYKSTRFPYERSNPLVCSWNVKVINFNNKYVSWIIIITKLLDVR